MLAADPSGENGIGQVDWVAVDRGLSSGSSEAIDRGEV